MNIKRFIVILLTFLVIPMGWAKDFILPSIKSATSFAIVVDSISYAKTTAEIKAYREVVERDGLGTYIFATNWKSPNEIRELLIKLHKEKKSPLEGVVLVGDIPIPMLRDAQHLTSAFKMNQTRNWQWSSVPSDRFYDDFGLTFNFLKQDSIQPLYYYYSLRADSEQEINSDIYSARIRPLEKGLTDKYTQLKEYLKKIVTERSKKPEVIDHLSMARGHGYNSESKVAWAGEQLALKEQFPELFGAENFVKFMDFESIWPMKPVWLAEVQRTDLDIMLFHHHGSNDVQYVNGYKNGSDVNTSINNIKLYLRSKIRTAVKRGKSKEEAITSYQKYLDVPREWCEETFDPKWVIEDSIFNLGLDIHVDDILKIKPNARFVMFDACYNGSFYEDQYIAGAYLFNNGTSIVAQGNTVNTIQDKWADEFLGLLNAGLRIGLWGKQVHFLETHILGDPTYHFANRSAVKYDINRALTVDAGNNRFWLKMLNHPDVDVQAMALRRLYLNKYTKISQLLKDTYFSSASAIVRLEAMQLLVKIGDTNTLDVLKAAVNDSYELTRRFSLEYIGKNGSDELIPAFVRSFFTDYTSKRVRFKQQQSYIFFNPELLTQEINKQRSQYPFHDEKVVDKLLKYIKKNKKSLQENITLIKDNKRPIKKRLLGIRFLRNRPVRMAIAPILAFTMDESNDMNLRIIASELLGWYNYSSHKEEVVTGLKKLMNTTNSSSLKAEALKSINRLTLN